MRAQIRKAVKELETLFKEANDPKPCDSRRLDDEAGEVVHCLLEAGMRNYILPSISFDALAFKQGSKLP